MGLASALNYPNESSYVGKTADNTAMQPMFANKPYDI